MPPDGAAAQLVRDTGAGWIAPSDDVEAMKAALAEIHRYWKDGTLDSVRLRPEWRDRLSRANRVEELADVLRSVA